MKVVEALAGKVATLDSELEERGVANRGGS